MGLFCSDTKIAAQPASPSYGEGMREALEAQVALLAGTKVGDADFSQFEGGLRELVREYEAPLRRETAQIDTDVLRQTLLGTEQRVVRGDDGRFGIPEEQATDSVKGPGGEFIRYGNDIFNPMTGGIVNTTDYLLDNGLMEQGPGQISGQPYYYITDKGKEEGYGDLFVESVLHDRELIYSRDGRLLPGANPRSIPKGEEANYFPDNSIPSKQGLPSKLDVLPDKIFTDLSRGVQDPEEEEEVKLTYTNPNIPADPTKAGQEGFDSEGRALLQEGQIVREGDGMIDLLGDRRNIMETRRLSRDERGLQLVEQNPELSALYEGAQNDPTNPFYGLSKAEAGRKLLDDNEGDLQKISEQFGIGNLTAPEFANVDTGRQAGFDAQGNFLGLSALAEDVQRANLSRQREADLADVERLSGRFQDVMADFRPGTTEALAGAREVLEAQRDRLTRPATQDDVQAGTATQVGDMISTGFQDPVFDAPTALGTDAGLARFNEVATQADVDAGRATTVGETIQVDPLRQRLIRDARDALSEGLTEREERQISEAARARATMMGRTFDQSEAIAEAQARVAEDNQRRMQNRAFASQILGQEAGLQSGDLGRGMQQELRQVGADMDAERLRQAQTAGFIDASTRLAGLEASTTMDPFASLLNRAGGGSLQAGQGVFGQAQYGLQSGPQYLNPEAGLGFISQMAANEASMYGANVAADAAIKAGLYQGIGSAIGGFCWVAREVYGPLNPQWLQFRSWLDTEAPNWFYNLYLKFGERFANWISDKPRIKAIIRKWMDTKIRG